MPDVRICEMAPRDGLQSLSRERLVPLDRKLDLIEALVAAGIDFLEIGSFVSPRAVPQLADTPELCAKLTQAGGVEYAALVPNMKHYERFRVSGLKAVALFVSASEAYAQFNTRQSIEESMQSAADVAAAARKDGCSLRAHLSASFQDIDGADIDVNVVVRIAHRLLEMGCDHVALADTKGTTHPKRVREVIGIVEREVGLERMGVHFHDSYGLGIANALTSFECGILLFDASVGGIGGTPFKVARDAPGGGGNIVTEELVFMFHQMGLTTGIDFDALLRAAEIVADIIQHTGDAPPPSKMLR